MDKYPKTVLRGFTLVEIMMVVAIIALLASIAIPNLLRAKMSTNDTLAQRTLRTLSNASEMYSAVNSGGYPATITSLTGATPPFLSSNPCDSGTSGYTYDCFLMPSGYLFVANPVTLGTSGSTSYIIFTGGVLQP